jgi:CRISPR/Cas system-associated exonuclease Cas4 (RecB family)
LREVEALLNDMLDQHRRLGLELKAQLKAQIFEVADEVKKAQQKWPPS